MKQQAYTYFSMIGLFFYFLLSGARILSQDDQGDFVRGNQLFLNGHYAQASELYEKIDNKGFAVLYNMTLAYLHQEKRGSAMVCIQRAEKQASFQQLSQLYEIVDALHRETNPDYTPSWYELFMQCIKKCMLSLSMMVIQLLVLLALALFMVCLYQGWYPKGSKSLACMVFFYILLVSIWLYKTHVMQRHVGIVTKKSIAVLAGPDTSFYKKSELYDSDEVIILTSQSGYYQVRSQQIIGWIHHKDIELV